MSQAGKTFYLVANLKSNKTLAETLAWVDDLENLDYMADNVQMIACLPFPYIYPVYQRVTAKSLTINLGTQDISPFPYGAYTGAVAADMVKDWVNYAIVGHSERRKYFHETNQEVANKVDLALEAGITPIVCVDEPYLDTQIEAINSQARGKLIFAYEPLAAIGSGHPDSPEHAQNVAKRIKLQAGNNVPVLYGGSVKEDNILEQLKQQSIDGVLVGGASLDSDSWKVLIK
jgi:triosephosphate isomerase (TIM)